MVERSSVAASALGNVGRTRDASRPLVSVVVPVYNEEPCLEALYDRLTSVLRSTGDHYEIVFVNDGSADRSLDILLDLKAKDPHVGVFSFSRNFGHESATSCGMDQATGQAVVLIDADLQDPPELILEMLEKWREGYDLIFAQRKHRAGETFLTKATSHLFYRVLNKVASIDIPLDTGDFRLMDRAVVDAFLGFHEKNRFVRGLVTSTGFRQVAVRYDRDARLAGETKYDFGKRLRLAIDAICGMSTVPLRFINSAGIGLTALGLMGGIAAIVHAVVVQNFSAANFIVPAIVGVGGIQLLCLGLLGEYIGRIFIEVKARPLYILEKSLPAQRNADSESDNFERIDQAA